MTKSNGGTALLTGLLAVSLLITAACYLQGMCGEVYSAALIWAASMAGAFLVWAAAGVICCLFVRKSRPCQTRSKLYRFYANCIIDILSALFRVDLQVNGLERLPAKKFLLVSNHRSALDPILQMGVLRRWNMGFVAKKELFKILIIGRLMHRCFCLSLDRGNPRRAVAAISQAADFIAAGQASVGIYPEGTRSKSGLLLPFHNGAFKIAQKARCPVVVAVIRGSEKILRRHFCRTRVTLDFLEVLPPEAWAGRSTAALGAQVRQSMETALQVSPDESAKLS